MKDDECIANLLMWVGSHGLVVHDGTQQTTRRSKRAARVRVGGEASSAGPGCFALGVREDSPWVMVTRDGRFLDWGGRERGRARATHL